MRGQAKTAPYPRKSRPPPSRLSSLGAPARGCQPTQAVRVRISQVLPGPRKAPILAGVHPPPGRKRRNPDSVQTHLVQGHLPARRGLFSGAGSSPE